MATLPLLILLVTPSVTVLCRQGFLHSPYEAPDVACRIYPSPENYYMTLDMTALSIYSDPDTHYLTPKQRGCRFSYESNLDISPVYTYHMCRVECRMKEARKLCGCVPYFYKQPLSECSTPGAKPARGSQRRPIVRDRLP